MKEIAGPRARAAMLSLPMLAATQRRRLSCKITGARRRRVSHALGRVAVRPLGGGGARRSTDGPSATDGRGCLIGADKCLFLTPFVETREDLGPGVGSM